MWICYMRDNKREISSIIYQSVFYPTRAHTRADENANTLRRVPQEDKFARLLASDIIIWYNSNRRITGVLNSEAFWKFAENCAKIVVLRKQARRNVHFPSSPRSANVQLSRILSAESAANKQSFFSIHRAE